jgi:4-amino-4-deoxy-L-arabinose transferase-like glycosyltransferase
MRTPATIPRGRLWLAILLFAMLWFGTIGERRLLNPDEGRYAEIPREMVASGDWITPRLNDLKYFEKPALQYWATATAFSVFGEHHWTARLWPALTGFLGILLTGYTAARLFNPLTGVVSAAVLAGSLWWTVIGHFNALDMGVSFFLSAAIFALCLSEHAGATSTESRRWRHGAWALLGLAVLSKGLIGLVIPGAAVFAYVLWQRDWNLLVRLRIFQGLLMVTLITAPWFIAVSLANPEFPNFFFIHEHFERFLTKVHARYQPPWFFIPVLLLGILPWIGALPGALRSGFQRDISVRFQPLRFLLVWMVVVFGFFSASSSKLAPYILPLFPALSVLIAHHLLKGNSTKALSWVSAPVLVLAPLAIVLGNKILARGNAESLAAYAGFLNWLYVALGGLALAGLLSLWFVRRQQLLAAVLSLALGGHLFAQAVLLGHDRHGTPNTGYDIAQRVLPQLPPRSVPFFSVTTYDQSLPFYLQRTMTLVQFGNEMTFGIGREPDKAIPDLASFEKTWRTLPQAWAVMSLETWQQFATAQLPMIEVARDTRRVVVHKP